MSEKVERLLNKENAIVQAPGSLDNSAFMVESNTSIRPHYVTIAKNGKVCCIDCPSWNARNLCAHSLAAAEKLGMTAKFIKWFEAKGLKQINLTALVTCDFAKGVGKKGKMATAVRKGGRNAGKTPSTVVVDRISFRAEPHPQNALASPSRRQCQRCSKLNILVPSTCANVSVSLTQFDTATFIASFASFDLPTSSTCNRVLCDTTTRSDRRPTRKNSFLSTTCFHQPCIIRSRRFHHHSPTVLPLVGSCGLWLFSVVKTRR